METLGTSSIAVIGQDEEAVDLGAIYAAHVEQLLLVALALLDTRSHAEEVVHEAFARLQQRIETGSVRIDHPLAYLRVIVLNLARAALRRRQVADRHRPESVAPVGPDELAEQSEQRRLVRQACADLPERQRAVIEMRYWHDLSEAEIARELDISAGSVKTHASRAKQALRNRLAASTAVA